ncbi:MULTISPECIES: hypothetical protein [Caballeronia]|jgi:hypothetical protein|uniref:Uncharacterized protein n=1 Tax=Caballeronia zhejiangensis TaxID=871203 RepID=A0A656QB50_9BURK|nr:MULTISPECIES: hypothetical protein [Caballeronia]EKS67741.1 hypothetical protein BURK_021955 [Burkholderia sp. SJ98]KDR25135.1 hypothetical protein BG60_31085 [Caballeronia zhejiangensis]MCG7405413.1 hypothetical protein [Caballeronia zhejiangensis]MCI1047515.1 hypothetical protein [Caballeronia zhejiangensis]MDR5765231.1 hypothetical protein [Caballeronia sp. LZ028]
MKSRFTAVHLRPVELADPHLAHLYMECADAEARLSGASRVAAVAVYEAREKTLDRLWSRLDALDPRLCRELKHAVEDWHEIAVKLRGGD